MGFKDEIQKDMGVLFNPDEFADTVNIDDQDITIIIDDDRLQKRASTDYGGISTGMILYFVPVASLGKRPSIGSTQEFNGRLMYVDDVKEHAGVYEIIITQNRSE
jgi:hypothetical protein